MRCPPDLPWRFSIQRTRESQADGCRNTAIGVVETDGKEPVPQIDSDGDVSVCLLGPNPNRAEQ